MKIAEMYDLSKTIAAPLFEGKTYPWEVLPHIEEFILELGKTLSENDYDKRGDNIWIARTAKVADTASITGPAIICDKTLRLYKGKGHSWCRSSSWQFHRA